MIDLHSHILPHFDDGPDSTKKSLELLRDCEYRDVTTMVATSHYYSAHMPIDEYCDRRARRIADLRRVLSENGVKVSIVAGAEVNISDIFLNRGSVKELCVENTSYILLEIPYGSKDFDARVSLIEQIASYHYVKPIVAHVERYGAMIRHETQIERLRDAGCLIQIDAQAVNAVLGREHRLVMRLLKCGLVDIVASDCHGGIRPQNLPQAYGIIGRRFGAETVKILQENAQLVLEDVPVDKICGRY